MIIDNNHYDDMFNSATVLMFNVDGDGAPAAQLSYQLQYVVSFGCQPATVEMLIPTEMKTLMLRCNFSYRFWLSHSIHSSNSKGPVHILKYTKIMIVQSVKQSHANLLMTSSINSLNESSCRYSHPVAMTTLLSECQDTCL